MTKFLTYASVAIWWPNFELMQGAPSGDKIWNECKWHHLVTKFRTNSSGAIWWPNFELMQVVPFGDQIWNKCKWKDLVTKFRTNSSGAIWWPIQVVPLKSILNYSSWTIYSRYGVNILGPLCLWQCFLGLSRILTLLALVLTASALSLVEPRSIHNGNWIKFMHETIIIN